METQFHIFKRDDAQRIMKGPVLRPEVRDRQGTIISKQVIADAAHDFLRALNAAKNGSGPGFMHEDFSRDLHVVESWILDTEVEYDIEIEPEAAEKILANPTTANVTLRKYVTKGEDDADVTTYKAVLPEGSWMLAVQALDDEVWEGVGTKFKGFSIGGDARVEYED